MSVKKILTYLLLTISIFMFSGIAKMLFASPAEELYSSYAIKKRIVREAVNHGLDPALALSIAKQESNFDRTAKSSVGAIGLFQLMPQTAKDLGVHPYYVDQNIQGGISYVKGLKDQFGSTKLALAAYNAGPGAVARYGGIPPYSETQHYVQNIMSYYHEYKKYPDPVLVERYDNTNDIAQVNNTDTSTKPNKRDEAIQFFSRIFGFIS